MERLRAEISKEMSSRGLTAYKLSKMSGVDKRTISNLLQNNYCTTPGTLNKLAEALGLKGKVKTLYLEVTPNNLSLPLRVCDDLIELCEAVGNNKNNIASLISKGKRGKIKHPRYITVVVYDCEE